MRKGGWYVLAAGALWGTTGTAQAFAPAGAQPYVIGALRLAIASAALIPYALSRRALPSAHRWPTLPTGVAALCMAAYQPLFFGAVVTTGVALGTIVAIGSAPVIAGALAWFVRGERPSPRWVVASALAVLGTALLFAGESGGGVTIEGIALALGAGAAYAVYVVASKSLLENQKPDAVIAVVFGLSALILLPVFFFAELDWVFTAGGAITVLYLGLVATAVAYVLFVRGLNLLPVGSTVTLSLAEPLTAAALGVIVLGERPGPAAVLGALLLLAGLAIIGLQPSRLATESMGT
ncbi:MAG: DMT family transporter [Anaerolineae bacterium]|nr:MAG: DMT family transporter [Anaerolineae bacterium]